ncbi:hypothetical protein CPC08DRAFT_817989 [Agrocybe pediades]|nr:hypothetical protein CPC08DRAFT_817989 [Agrocybe pediades]
MQTTSYNMNGSPPISRLHEEILWIIWLENTEAHHDHRLSTARYSSQVCRKWRNLMLTSSSIWGRLLDLNIWNPWMEEVMSRSGKAPLWIVTGAICKWPWDYLSDFLLNFISDSWARIERLHIYDDLRPYPHGPTTEYSRNAREQCWLDLFSRPAPLLEEFKFHYLTKDDDPDAWHAPLPWFNSLAPRLRMFSVYKCPNDTLITRLSAQPPLFKLGMPSSWLSKLRSFTLCQRWDAPDLLSLLRKMPLLEELEITSCTASGGRNESVVIDDAPVFLPRLSALRLVNWVLSDIVGFLGPISACVNCCLSMSAPRNNVRTSTSILPLNEAQRAQRVVLRYLQNYNEARSIAKLSLSSNSRHIHILEDAASDGLSIYIPRTATNDSWLLSMLFNSTFLSSTTTLHVGEWEAECPEHIYASSFFNAVHTLSITQHAFPFLIMYLDRGHRDSFPLLHTLRVEGQQRVYSDYVTLLHQFLRKRQDLSRPISVLDLSDLNLKCFRSDFDEFEEFVGLSISFPGTLFENGQIPPLELVQLSLSSSGTLPENGQMPPSYLCDRGDAYRYTNIDDEMEVSRPIQHRHPQKPAVAFGWSGYT